jgi:hypothetical protein
MEQRKTLLIDKSFQYPFIRRNIIFFLCSLVLICGVLWLWNHFKYTQGFLVHPPNGEQVETWAKANNVSPDSAEYAYQFIVQAKPYTFFDLIWKPVAIVLAINLILLIGFSVYFSHQIAGPIYRVKKTLQSKINGENAAPIKFRKNDPFHDLADLINQALNLK